MTQKGNTKHLVNRSDWEWPAFEPVALLINNRLHKAPQDKEMSTCMHCGAGCDGTFFLLLVQFGETTCNISWAGAACFYLQIGSPAAADERI